MLVTLPNKRILLNFSLVLKGQKLKTLNFEFWWNFFCRFTKGCVLALGFVFRLGQ